jgi:hypothetical protein
MSAVTVKGLETLQRRLKGAALPQDFARSVRQEAEALAAAARDAAPDALGQTVEIRDESRGERPAFAIGTAHPAGRHIEFGTARQPATPWLMPLFWARSRAIRERLGKILVRSVRGL